MDRRLTPFSGRIAHVSLQVLMPGGTRFTQGEATQVIASLAWLRAAPGGAVDRQLLYGDRVTVIERRAGSAFVWAQKDGYCGWLPEADLGPQRPATHRVATPATHLYPSPKVQAHPPKPLFLNALIEVIAIEAAWAQTAEGYIPARHLAPIGQFAADPAQIAEAFLHVPYLWAGNSAAGIDCSGLVQMSLHACGMACPGDSDLQRQLGQPLAPQADMARGDLLFWQGHVAMALGPETIIHANGYRMAVSIEPLAEAETRIVAQYGSGLLARRRPEQASG